ncbi:hypothetical protein ABBQ38_011872 [Trebouxia sp. C0009 RCD-2024]
MNADGHAATASQSAGPRNDLEFVARLLGDPVVLPVPVQIPSTSYHKAAKKRRRATLEAKAAGPAEEAKALLTGYNTPTFKTDSKRYFCEACSCSVPARDGDWDVHVSGVKHQRQLVSLLHTGQLGNTVVSLFEAEPVSGAVAASKWDKWSSADYSHLDRARLQSAKTLFLKGLLNLGGNSVYTKRIAEHYTDASLCCMWSSAASKMAGQAALGSTRHLKIRADELVCASQMLRDYGSIQCLTVTNLCSAGAAHAESEDQTQAWKCMEDSVAISMLLQACQSLHTLESLVIRFTHVGTCHQTVRERVPRKDPFQDISRIYGPVWFDLQGLLRKGLSLRGVNIALSCQYPWNVNMSMLKAAAQQGHQARTAQLESAVLMGMHARLGAGSNLRHLPVSMVRKILTLALPQEPCQVWVSTAHSSWAEA